MSSDDYGARHSQTTRIPLLFGAHVNWNLVNEARATLGTVITRPTYGDGLEVTLLRELFFQNIDFQKNTATCTTVLLPADFGEFLARLHADLCAGVVFATSVARPFRPVHRFSGNRFTIIMPIYFRAISCAQSGAPT